MDDVCRDEKYKDRCNAFYSAMQNNLHLTGGKNEDEQKKDKVCERNAVEEDTKVLDDELKSVYY